MIKKQVLTVQQRKRSQTKLAEWTERKESVSRLTQVEWPSSVSIGGNGNSFNPCSTCLPEDETWYTVPQQCLCEAGTSRVAQQHRTYYYCETADTYNTSLYMMGRPESATTGGHGACYGPNHDQSAHIQRLVDDWTIYQDDGMGNDEIVPFPGPVRFEAKAIWLFGGSTLSLDFYIVPNPPPFDLPVGDCLAEPDQWAQGTFLGTMNFTATSMDGSWHICNDVQTLHIPSLAHGRIRIQSQDETTVGHDAYIVNPNKTYTLFSDPVAPDDYAPLMYYCPTSGGCGHDIVDSGGTVIGSIDQYGNSDVLLQGSHTLSTDLTLPDTALPTDAQDVQDVWFDGLRATPRVHWDFTPTRYLDIISPVASGTTITAKYSTVNV